MTQKFIHLLLLFFFTLFSSGLQQTSSPSSSPFSFDALHSQLGALLCIPRIFAQCPQMNSYFTAVPLRELLFSLNVNWPKSKVEAASYCKNLKAFQGCFPGAIVKQCSLPADTVQSVTKMYIDPYLDRYQSLACTDEQAQIRFLNRANCYRKEEVRTALADFIHRSVILGKEMKLVGEVDEEGSRQAMCCMALYGGQNVHAVLVKNCGQEVAQDVEKVFLEEMGGSSVKLIFALACSKVQLTSYEDCAQSLKSKSVQKSLDFALKLSPVVKRESIEEMVLEMSGQLPVSF